MSERFSELLPWYVNNTLSAEDRAWVDRYLAEHPEARVEPDWYRSLQTKIHDSVPAIPATIGLAKTMKLIRGDRPTISERISAFFGDFGLRPAMALAVFALLAVQGGVIFNLMRHAQEDEMEIRALKAIKVEEGPLLKVNFAPDAKEADIRFLLVQVQGTIAGGPGQLGDYYVRVPAGKENEMAQQLKGNKIVQAVDLVPGLPTKY
jgi:hypothetical protein